MTSVGELVLKLPDIYLTSCGTILLTCTIKNKQQWILGYAIPQSKLSFYFSVNLHANRVFLQIEVYIFILKYADGMSDNLQESIRESAREVATKKERMSFKELQKKHRL